MHDSSSLLFSSLLLSLAYNHPIITLSLSHTKLLIKRSWFIIKKKDDEEGGVGGKRRRERRRRFR
jgi:hypothetical protein